MSASLARRLVSHLLRRITVGCLVVEEEGDRRIYGSGAPAATIRVHSARTWRKLLRGSRGLAESYAEGLWDTPDLVDPIRAPRNAGDRSLSRGWRRCAGRATGRGNCLSFSTDVAGAKTSVRTTTSATTCSR